MTTIAKRPPSDGWVGIRKRRRAFCEAFVREHHPGMVSDKLPKECRPLVPLDGPAIHYDISTSHWWLETNELDVGPRRHLHWVPIHSSKPTRSRLDYRSRRSGAVGGGQRAVLGTRRSGRP